MVGSETIGGNGQGSYFVQNHYTFQETLTYIRDRQTVRAGGGITRSQMNFLRFHYFGGLLFESWPDVLLGLPGGPESSGGNGTPFSNVIGSIDIPGFYDRAWRILDGDAFVQDDVKLGSSLTLNVGLRYERLGSIGDTLGRNGGFDPSLANPNPPAGGTLRGYVVSDNFPSTIPAGVTQLKNNFGIRGDHQNNWEPRMGFAWRLPRTKIHFTDRMVLRGGYGIYYSRTTGQPFIQLGTAPPFGLAREQSSLRLLVFHIPSVPMWTSLCSLLTHRRLTWVLKSSTSIIGRPGLRHIASIFRRVLGTICCWKSATWAPGVIT